MTAADPTDNDRRDRLASFALPAMEYVDKCCESLGLSTDEVTSVDRRILTGAIERGVGKLAVYECLRIRKHPGNRSVPNKVPSIFQANDDAPFLIETLLDFAKDNDSLFLDYSFEHICGRKARPGELLAFEFDLRRGVRDRMEVISRIVDTARSEGHDVYGGALNPVLRDRGLEGARSTIISPGCGETPGAVLDGQGAERIVVVYSLPAGARFLGFGALRQEVAEEGLGWRITEGLVVAGPNKTVKPGIWRVLVNLIQNHDSVVNLQITANAGLDILQDINICGSFCGTFMVDVLVEHLFLDMRLFKPQQAPEHNWIDIREMTLQWAAP